MIKLKSMKYCGGTLSPTVPEDRKRIGRIEVSRLRCATCCSEIYGSQKITFCIMPKVTHGS